MMSPDSDVDICILVGVIKEIDHRYVEYTCCGRLTKKVTFCPLFIIMHIYRPQYVCLLMDIT